MFFKGCPLDCWWCHNPESKRRHRELVYWPDRCIRCGSCALAWDGASEIVQGRARPPYILGGARDYQSAAAACPTTAMEVVGREVSPGALMRELERDILFYDESQGGVTFSGGEPLCQPEFLLEILDLCRARGIHTAIDTSGYCAWDDLAAVAARADLFLYDLKAMDPDLHAALTGMDNALILSNLQRLAASHGGVRVRLPLVPGHNDHEGGLIMAGQYLASLGISDVGVLPYHPTGAGKYHRLGMEYRLESLLPPDAERLGEVRQLLQNMGFAVEIGGWSVEGSGAKAEGAERGV